MTSNKVAWCSVWTRQYNNIRHSELMPRLQSVDKYYVHLSRWWPVRGVQRRLWQPLLVRLLARRYSTYLCTAWWQARLFRGKVVIDLDDPVFSEREIGALEGRNIVCVVVTTERVRDRLREAGVRTPVKIIPQGVALDRVRAERVRMIREGWHELGGEVIAGLHQPHFELAHEVPASRLARMYAVDHLLEVFAKVVAEEPQARLCLVGHVSTEIEAYAKGHRWLKLVGYVPHEDVLNYVSAFDIGLFPREVDAGGWGSIKLLEYMACGVPVVGTRVSEMDEVQEAKAGIRAEDWDDFALWIKRLSREDPLRLAMGERGQVFAAARTWENVATEYEGLLARFA
jgi:glycosyltransferase involved in cell wall biosynthesis